MKPRRRFALKAGLQFRHANFSSPAGAHGLAPIAYLALDTAKPTNRPPIEQPQNLHPAIALRAAEEAPRSAVRELAQHEAIREVAVSQPDDGRRALGSDLA